MLFKIKNRQKEETSGFVNEIKTITKLFKKNYFVLYIFIVLFGPFGLMYATPFWGFILSCVLILAIFFFIPSLIVHFGTLQLNNIDLSNLVTFIKTNCDIYNSNFFTNAIFYISICIIIGVYLFSFVIGTKKIHKDNKELYKYALALYEWKNLKDELSGIKSSDIKDMNVENHNFKVEGHHTIVNEEKN